MLIGADVTHPSPGGSESAPSVAGIVGSLDANCARYAARIQVQEHREEMITRLDDAVVSLLKEFHRSCHGAKPERIIFYRDGVAEGQFAHCLDRVRLAVAPAVISLMSCAGSSVALPLCAAVDFAPGRKPWA